MFIKRVAAAFALLLASQAAHAAIIEHGTYFNDTTSGLDWLNNTPLAGQSYNSVLNGFGGYTNSSWRFATGSEISSLVATYVGPLPVLNSDNGWTYRNTTAGAYSSAYSLIQLLGVNVSFGLPDVPSTAYAQFPTDFTGIASQGFYDDGSGTSTGIFDLTAYNESPLPLSMTQIIPNFVSRDYLFGTNVSSILVRNIASESESVVPEPGTWVLFLTALCMLGFMRRKGVSATKALAKNGR